eukprot:11185274-Lingulodinium_polyedra.AAC.1
MSMAGAMANKEESSAVLEPLRSQAGHGWPPWLPIWPVRGPWPWPRPLQERRGCDRGPPIPAWQQRRGSRGALGPD